jgi:hypothetical protein
MKWCGNNGYVLVLNLKELNTKHLIWSY